MAHRITVQLDALDDQSVTNVVILRELDDGQLSIMGSKEFGPFTTTLEVSQWLTRALKGYLPLRLG